MTTHELRTWPGPFASLLDGTKRHEVRRKDRDFRILDILRLREWDPGHKNLADPTAPTSDEEKYTGRELWAQVTYITEPGTWGIPPEVCVMSVRILVSSDGHALLHQGHHGERGERGEYSERGNDLRSQDPRGTTISQTMGATILPAPKDHHLTHLSRTMKSVVLCICGHTHTLHQGDGGGACTFCDKCQKYEPKE
jgi:hypothetical protein